MPLYDFKCTKCEAEFEQIVKRPVTYVTCICGHTAMRKEVYAPSFTVKGHNASNGYNCEKGKI